MLRLLDGPAEGTYMVQRAPVYLRAVVGPREKKDVLDKLDDTPTEKEQVYVYQLVTKAGMIHIKMSGKGSGFYATGDYRHLEAVEGEQFRDTATWQQWCRAEYERPGTLIP